MSAGGHGNVRIQFSPSNSTSTTRQSPFSHHGNVSHPKTTTKTGSSIYSPLKISRYKYLRHPSYVGWFYWSIGTQLLICNPLCSVAYAFASWRFFKVRIAYEEDLLQRQYPKKYSSYIDSSWLGIPFIKSRKLLPPPNGLTMPTNEQKTTRGKND